MSLDIVVVLTVLQAWQHLEVAGSTVRLSRAFPARVAFAEVSVSAEESGTTLGGRKLRRRLELTGLAVPSGSELDGDSLATAELGAAFGIRVVFLLVVLLLPVFWPLGVELPAE